LNAKQRTGAIPDDIVELQPPEASNIGKAAHKAVKSSSKGKAKKHRHKGMPSTAWHAQDQM
jgi:hypothetical protein